MVLKGRPNSEGVLGVGVLGVDFSKKTDWDTGFSMEIDFSRLSDLDSEISETSFK